MGSKRKRTTEATAAPAAKKQATSKPVATPLDCSPFLENPTGADKKREVQLYEQLASEVDSERLDAANAIVLGLLGGEGVHESTLQRHLEKLLRGLASGRKGARLGFGVVVTEILAQLLGADGLAQTKYPGTTFDKTVSVLVAKTKPDGDLSGQEEKDHALGLLFGLQSFVRAKIFFGEDERWNDILEKLLDLSHKKPWTREECGWVIVEALAQMSQSQAEGTLVTIHSSGLASSPEGVGIWITARNRFPQMKIPSKSWGKSGNPLDDLQKLAKALKESSGGEDDSKNKKVQQAKQTGNWNAQLHFVWDIVLAQFSRAVKAKTEGIKTAFKNFWKVAVDENLFSKDASRERRYWGFLLFQKVLQNPDAYSKFFSYIFSPNLIRCLINSMQDQDRFLNRAADKSLKVLIQTVEASPSSLVSVLPRLIGGHGNYNFDRVTKTKTIEKLLANVNEDNAKGVFDALVAPALSEESADAIEEAEKRRVLLGDYILNIVRNINVTDDSQDWIGEIALTTLAKVAYGNDLICMPPLSEKTRTLFRNRLMSVFGHLLSDLKGFVYPCELLQSFTPDAVDMDEEISKAKDKAIATVEKILKKAKKAKGEQEKPPLQALALLYALVIFQLYNGESDAISILDELKLCYNKLIRHKDDADSDDVDASEVLVELLLSFISKPSALLRKVTQHVFSAFMADMTSGGLKLMTDVLASDESLRGQQDLFDQEPEDGAFEEDGDEDDDEVDSDVEVVDMNGEEGHLNGHLHEESDDDDDDNDNDEEESEDEAEEGDDEEAQKLNDALAKALGTHRLDQDLAEAEESDSDADMTDSEMMALDSKLVEIFSQRKKIPNKKQEQKDAKENMVNFKSRVLDLLEIYVKKQAGNPLAFGLLPELLKLIRTTKTKQLAERAHTIILAFSKAAKGTKSDCLSVPETMRLLKIVHTEVLSAKDTSSLYAKGASSASLLVATSLYRADKGTLGDIMNVYRDTQFAWGSRGQKMLPVFAQDFWTNWCQSLNS